MIRNLIGGFRSEEKEKTMTTCNRCPKCDRDTVVSEFEIVEGELALQNRYCERCDN